MSVQITGGNVLRLGGNSRGDDGASAMETSSTVDAGVVASVAAQVPKASAAAPLLVKIVQNLEKDPTNEKFRSINLDGKAGAKLVCEPAAMTLLATVGFVQEGNRLVASGAPPAGAGRGWTRYQRRTSASTLRASSAPPPTAISRSRIWAQTDRIAARRSDSARAAARRRARARSAFSVAV